MRGRGHRILLNLAGNAVKFTSTGSVKIVADPEAISVSVTDTGNDIAPEHFERIFEAFAQASAPPETTGTGLGLAISRRMAGLLGGTVSVKSAPGVGSTFTVAVRRVWQPASVIGVS